ncbi:regulatory LuxR family protein [Kribbella amoyensis]|uniref:Regulatory LuxR family protein n=1 Tax=Kribbella amoyensis TaxID=996641 RepID=A0A561C0J7_9ACTN|nr:helix-turn-helix transcriptional regulator [Kribbella amoyensis]TWD84686.1 regulatory LuxR family protein [Kribbella amoyensis]
MVVGRDSERERVAAVLGAARGGRSGALVVSGEVGAGKSTVLEFAVGAAEGMVVLSAAGTESEAEIPYGALHLLLHRYLDRLDAVPRPQAAALRAAFGLAEPGAGSGDRFLVGAATLSLLAELAGEQPLVCVIDDAQWLDQASADALYFAARRLGADPIAMLFAVRDEGDPVPAGIETVRLPALSPAEAEQLLTETAPDLAVPVRNRVLAEAAGNPLAIVELGAATGQDRPPADDQVAPLRVAGRVQGVFRAQLGQLPAATRLVMAVAAADQSVGLDTTLRAAAELGTAVGDLEPAEQARLVQVTGNEVHFRHPLVRSVVYQDTPHHQRITIHAALAAVLTDRRDADRRAWHRAAAATGADEEIAEELERAARRAQDRGGMMAVAVASERAARLSTDDRARARRIVQAARAAYDAGRPQWANDLALEAAAGTDEPALVAEATFLRAQVEYESMSPEGDARLALEAAELVARSDPELAASMLTEAVYAARDAAAPDLLARGVGLLEQLDLPADSGHRLLAAGLIGWNHLLAGESQVAIPLMRSLVSAAESGALSGHLEGLGAGFTGLLAGQDQGARALLEAATAAFRAEGALTWLTYALEPLAIEQLLRGDFHGAEASVAEGSALASALGMAMQAAIFDAIAIWLAALFADEKRCHALASTTAPAAKAHPAITALAEWGLAMLDLAAGRSSAAFDRLDTVCGGPARYDVVIRAVPDHVEAAVRSGRPEAGRRYLAGFDLWAGASGQPHLLALSRRCHALLDADARAEDHFTAALDLHGSRRYDEARTELAYGEWLRRRRRRADAKDVLIRARDGFERLGATGWAARARAELDILGGAAAPADDADLRSRLTPQELQVVRLAAAGYSNREIAAQLFLSPRTIGHHLYRAFPKIGISKRIELTQLDL